MAHFMCVCVILIASPPFSSLALDCFFVAWPVCLSVIYSYSLPNSKHLTAVSGRADTYAAKPGRSTYVRSGLLQPGGGSVAGCRPCMSCCY
ncbi:hypothetical protein B0T24DRAFT_641751 [Lasiosphaeria ovina]|uniref:Secreted protein n=1 Tax=Lasiosphaeria ovina TaxID=92902 RepID=A0AAE0JTL7_9PEZI|nr:hypothetical protein B0T24DRAFT_641751 [Lasiosphaeria ovina]